MNAMNTLKIKMAKTRETKRTIVFIELDDDGLPIEDVALAKVGTLYLKKSLQPANSITVTIEETE